jgi:hypothetical protein
MYISVMSRDVTKRILINQEIHVCSQIKLRPTCRLCFQRPISNTCGRRGAIFVQRRDIAICFAPKFLDAHATTNVQFIAAPMQAASIAGMHKAVASFHRTI